MAVVSPQGGTGRHRPCHLGLGAVGDLPFRRVDGSQAEMVQVVVEQVRSGLGTPAAPAGPDRRYGLPGAVVRVIWHSRTATARSSPGSFFCLAHTELGKWRAARERMARQAYA
jgi:hypothetical protein